ncbi:glycosyltransferase family 2 protein [Vibrio sinaloensis]|uniref:glycosyltransferase family 2 protein n=1 Tax=Photobacterium sp. (strain ATCC 43367) TaxID=379097 RepID=UPI00068B2196|nr:glycosyltransferase family 2 protein [Vibrio sinaloensis]
MKSPLISVIIPSFSRATMLPRAIDSILSQTHTNVEVIVIDDNGSGTRYQIETRDSILKYLVNDNVKYIVNPSNIGGSESRNIGIDNARGEYITFLDDDDEYYVDKLEKQLKFYLENFPNKNGFINSQVDVARNGKVFRTTKSNIDYNELLFCAVSERIVGTPTFFMPKRVIDSVGGFPIIQKGQEWALSIKLIESGIDFRTMNDALVKVNLHDQGSIFDGNKSSEKKLNGLTNVYNIQKTYFSNFSRSQIRYIESRHCLSMARFFLSSHKLKSFSWMIKSLSFSLPNRDFFVVLAKLLLSLIKVSPKIIR